MSALQALLLLLVAAAGTGVVVTREPLSQTIVAAFYGVLLALTFFVFMAPDVALSEIVVGALAFPMMILLALAKVRGRAE